MFLIPVTLLTGFLGSGKSSLLREILREPTLSNTAVVINEFGEVDIDGLLVTHSDERLIQTTSGCLCCTIRGDIRDTLYELFEGRRHAEVPPFTRLIVETTGLADPAPIIHTLMQDGRIGCRYSLGGVVTTIDSLCGEDTLNRHVESMKQAAVADRLLLTKTDLLTPSQRRSSLSRLKKSLNRLNPTAVVLDRHRKGFNFSKLFDTSLYDPIKKTDDVRKWLNAEAILSSHDHHNHDHHDIQAHNSHEQHAHDTNRHSASIQAQCFVFDAPFDMGPFIDALEELVADHGANLLRMKGVVQVRQRPDTPLVLHGVQHVLHPPIWLEKWPDADRRTKLVFITQNIDRSEIAGILNLHHGAPPTLPHESSAIAI